MDFGFRVGYGYPWIIYSGKIRVWILTGIDNRVSMGKLFGSSMGIPDPYPTHSHPYIYVQSMNTCTSCGCGMSAWTGCLLDGSSALRFLILFLSLPTPFVCFLQVVFCFDVYIYTKMEKPKVTIVRNCLN